MGFRKCSLIIFGSVSLFPQIAMAYIGPGVGLSAIGTVIALLGAIVLGIVGFVWYPVKRLLKARKKQAAVKSTEEDNASDKS